jgi:hypothetical protein
MCESNELIPSPPIVRNRLARALREARLLRRLLRLALVADEDQRRGTAAAPESARRKEGVR